MHLAIQLDDDAYAIAKAFAEQEHCSIGSAASKLVVKAGAGRDGRAPRNSRSEVRFPLVRGTRPVTSEDVACLQDES